MNFLAHALLAGDDPALIVGGVAGDFIKGTLERRLAEGLPPDLVRGVALHRAIDAFAESHPAFRRSRDRISPLRRRYAGVLVDVLYDHLLAREWAAHHPRPLPAFVADVYALIGERLGDLGPAAPTLRLMAAEDWLGSYASRDGIAAILERMARRARRPNPLAGGEDELADNAAWAADCGEFVADAMDFAAAWSARNPAASAR